MTEWSPEWAVRGGTESRSSLSSPLLSQGRAVEVALSASSRNFPHKCQRLFVDAEYFVCLFLLMERRILFTEHTAFVGKHNSSFDISAIR